jgi:hypothetical protein
MAAMLTSIYAVFPPAYFCQRTVQERLYEERSTAIARKTATNHLRTLELSVKHGLQQVRRGTHMLPAGKDPGLIVMATAPACMLHGCLSMCRTSCDDKQLYIQQHHQPVLHSCAGSS